MYPEGDMTLIIKYSVNVLMHPKGDMILTIKIVQMYDYIPNERRL